jgi:hypothetical protein
MKTDPANIAGLRAYLFFLLYLNAKLSYLIASISPKQFDFAFPQTPFEGDKMCLSGSIDSTFSF